MDRLRPTLAVGGVALAAWLVYRANATKAGLVAADTLEPAPADAIRAAIVKPASGEIVSARTVLGGVLEEAGLKNESLVPVAVRFRNGWTSAATIRPRLEFQDKATGAKVTVLPDAVIVGPKADIIAEYNVNLTAIPLGGGFLGLGVSATVIMSVRLDTLPIYSDGAPTVGTVTTLASSVFVLA